MKIETEQLPTAESEIERERSREPVVCGFCGKSQYEVTVIIQGAKADICGYCVCVCVDIMNEELGRRLGFPSANAAPTEEP